MSLFRINIIINSSIFILCIQFYLMLNVAVGGTSGFLPDDWKYNSRKPWNDGSTKELEEFWAAKHEWQPSWIEDKVAMEVGWVEMYQYN